MTTDATDRRQRHGQYRESDDEYRVRVADYYGNKTDSILAKYGPGPRVHYHLGYYVRPPQQSHDLECVRSAIVAAQELLMIEAAAAWSAETTLTGDVLDVGCGLGGGTIFWAQEYGAMVTGVTIARGHAPLVTEFARHAGVQDRVQVICCDACEVSTHRPYDAVVAMESSCHLPRPRWFGHLAKLVRPGGHVCIEEIFEERPGGASTWNRHFRAQAGTVASYVAAAHDAGFRLEVDTDITRHTADFWLHSTQWMDALLRTEETTPGRRRQVQVSREIHSELYNTWNDGGVSHRLLRFRTTR